MSLNPVASSIAVPPLNLLPLAFAGLLLSRRFRRVGSILAVSSIVALFLLGLPIVADTLICSLEQGLPTMVSEVDPPEAIVILSAEATRGSGPVPAPTVGPLSLERLRTGVELYHRVRLPILVAGGIPPGGRVSVAILMARVLQEDFQTPVGWIEGRSEDTLENAARSATILKASGVHSVYLVSHAWHLRRANMAFRRFGIRIVDAPVRIDSWPGDELDDYVPHASAWMKSYYATHEWIGCLWYAIAG